MSFTAGTHRAQQEREARGYQWLWAGVKPVDVIYEPPVVNWIRTAQELPSHPGSQLRAGIQGPNVKVPVTDRILTRQELPDHPGSRFVAGIQGPNVKVPVSDRILTLQELPHYPTHPRSQFWPGIQGPNVAPPPQVQNRIVTTQEQPWHPKSFFWIAPPPVRAQLPFLRPLLVTQEYPWHPGSFFHAGTPPVSYEDIEFFVIN